MQSVFSAFAIAPRHIVDATPGNFDSDGPGFQQEYFRQGGEGLSFEQVVAGWGFKPKRLSQPTRLR